MLAHYIRFISQATPGIFMFLAIITSPRLWKKCIGCNHDREATSRKALSSYLHMQVVVLLWVAARYQHHFSLCLLIDTFLESLHQFIYFYTLLWPGKTRTWNAEKKYSSSENFMFFSGKDFSHLHHWRVTLTLLNTIGALLVQFAYQSYTARFEIAFYNIGTLFLAICLYAWIKDYVEHYVDTSKI